MIPCNTIQYNAITCKTMQYHKIPFNSMQYHAIKWNNMRFSPKNGIFRQLGPYNGLPSGQTATYRKTKGIQSYLRIWGCYDPIEWGPTETKKGGLYGCSVRKSDFRAILSAQKRSLTAPRRSPCNAVNTKTLSFRCPVMMVTIFLRLSTKN